VGAFYAASAKKGSGVSRRASSNEKAFLIVAGILGYTLAQGLQYVGLFYLSADATSFVLNFTQSSSWC
jgi:hypothetical protein